MQQAQPYKFIIGARDTAQTQASYDELKYDNDKHSVAILPLQLSDLRGVKSFAQQALDKLGENKLDYLFLNAAIGNGAPVSEPGPHGSKWCESYIVNHLCKIFRVVLDIG